MTIKIEDLAELTYDEFIEKISADNDLVEIADKVEDDSVKSRPSEKSEEGVTVVVKDGTISDSDAKLSYSNRNQTIYAHALMHMWWHLPEKTKWTRIQVAREHTRIIAKLVSNGWGHMIKDTLDDSLPQSLMQDYAPSTGEEIVKPTKIIIVTNGKREVVKEIESETMEQKAPIADSSGLQNDLAVDIGAMRVILNQSEFEPSVTIEDRKSGKDDQDYKKHLDDNQIGEELGEDEEGLYLRVNAMHEGTWNFTEITKEELEKAASSFAGRLVIEGHKWDDPERSLGEVLKAGIKFDPEYQKFYLELIVKITRARGIKEVKAGRYKFVSIGATMKARCNICGMTINEGCHHIRGIEYDTEEHGRIICIKTATEIIFEELSFINVPAARWARVLEQIDPLQARELLAASKSGSTVSIEIETEEYRLLPTLDEMLSLQEESIIQLNKRNEEVTGMAENKEKKDQEGKETFVTPPGSNVTDAQAASIPQNTTKKPVATTPAPKKSKSKGNVSDVAAPKNPVSGGQVDTGKNASGTSSSAPAPKPSPSKGNVSKVSATEDPRDGGTVDTGGGSGRSDVKGSSDNPVVDSDEVTTDDAKITLTNEQIDDMDIGAIYEFAKNNEMTGLIEVLVAANAEGECESPVINTASADEAILAHALLHRWGEDLTLTNWNGEQINVEHDRIVGVLSDFGIGHEDSENETSEEADSSNTTDEAETDGAGESTDVGEVNDDAAAEGDAADSTEEADGADGAGEATDENAEATDATDDTSTADTAEADSTEKTDDATTGEAEANNDTVEVSPDMELLTIQLENSQVDIRVLQEKFDAATTELSEVKENLSKELYDAKLALAKSIRENKKMVTEVGTVNGLLTAKTTELEALNSQLEKYVTKELSEVVEGIIQVKTDLNKYADEDAINADREKFSSMSLEVLQTLIGELKAIKDNSLKNKAATEHGIGDVTKESDKADVVSGDNEIEKYGQTDENTEENDDEKKNFDVAENSVLALVKDSLNIS
jgi:hypothetical protein